ncbi:sensory box protein [Asticcacaulis biprosthecium C19]|uniref:Sensory box protein n=1 Tax=Asticcacaulis biprosthecium C19 TaxID=715226 RepID=F4QII1_9CAUL|nr:PAS domain-containing protein [Asticcacaulis biprosthecium]EGF92970.1 sensory box protein [Asticcacaulis biprosthecium C19]
MFWHNDGELAVFLGVVAAILLFLSIAGGVIAALKAFQVRQFQDLLFKAERKIDTLERRMFNVLNAVPVALVETDITGKFTFANKTAHQLLGRKDAELIGLRFHAATWGIAFPDGRAIPADLMPIARALRGQTVKGFQHLLTNYGGHDKVMVSVTAMPIMNSAGEVIGSTSAMVEIETWSGEGVDDVTGAWRGHWFSAATVPFWGLDAQGVVLDVNSAALDAFELKREEVVGKAWAQLFVADGDFQAALDYLGDIQDESDIGDASVALKLKTPGAEASYPCTVTGWVVRTHEGGPNGLTVMAMPAEQVVVAPRPVAAPLNDTEQQELEDFRNGEKALAALGVGVWQYDPEADTIVEDAGMRALIGRDEPGGPTLISEDDQVKADDAFSRLKSGQDDLLQLDIWVAQNTDSARWITLKGQATIEDGERQIYGIAYDSTEWKQAIAAVPVEPQILESQISEADLNAARQAARDVALAELEVAKQTARQAGRDEALAEVEAARAEIERLGADQGDVYAWHSFSQAAPEPIIVHEPDPVVVAENEALKTEVAALQAELETLRNLPAPEPVIVREADPAVVNHNAVLKAQLDVLNGELDSLRKAGPVIEADPAVVAENAVLKSRLAELESEIEATTMARDAVQEELDTVLSQPLPDPDYSGHEARIRELQDQTEAARQRYDDLAQRYHVLSHTPDPEPDYSDHEARIAALQTELDQARAELEATGAETETLRARPEPDYAPYEARIADLSDELKDVRDAHEVLRSRYAELAAAPAPDYTPYESKLAVANNELAKWQAAHRDLQGRLDELNTALNSSQTQMAGMQVRIDQMNAALSNAQRFETVGRLTGDVAQDFAQMLQVVNGALDVMARTTESPESVRRLAEAALIAGKRGERLTRQLQAFQSEEF